jgi:Sulfotransferase family
MTEGIVARENRARTEAYRKDEGLEQALLEINQALEPHEPEVDDIPPRPHLFVFGLPRSGTTLAHQILAWSLDVGYVTNVMARFWLAPYAGAVLSRATLGDLRDGSFASDYGKSFGPAGSHEFAYFWQRWLGIRDVADLLDFSGDSERADWSGAAAAVRRIGAAFGKPLLFKTNYAAQFLPGFARTFPMPLFVHVRRDPVQVALSILAARRSYYGTTDTWWATYPPDYERLSGLVPAEQIAGQVAGLRAAYAAQAAAAAALTVEVDYEEMCADPEAVVESVRQRCLDVHGETPRRLNALTESFERAPTRTASNDEERAVVEAVTAALTQ